MRLGDRTVALSIGAIAVGAYLAVGFGLATDYDYYGRLANALLHGRWWLEEAPSWLNELLSCGDGRFCVAYPAFPALALVAARRRGVTYRTALLGVVLGGLPLALLYVGYDLLRWETPLDAGYARLAEGDFFFNHGLFSILYLPRHLYAIFLAPPEIVDGTPFFLRPRFEGMSLFLTTPAFLWIFVGLRQVRRDAIIAATATAALLALLPDVFHGTVGFQQFGYRFSIDAQPFLVTLALAGDGLSHGVWRRWPSILFGVVVALSLVINLY